MALRLIICGAAADGGGGGDGGIGLAAAGGGMCAVTVDIDIADAAVQSEPALRRDLPRGPHPLRARPPLHGGPPLRAPSCSLTDAKAERSQGKADLPSRPGPCASWRRTS